MLCEDQIVCFADRFFTGEAFGVFLAVVFFAVVPISQLFLGPYGLSHFRNADLFKLLIFTDHYLDFRDKTGISGTISVYIYDGGD